jgi:enamine deaminase RidA (YjgF/YER057c/UK114 family)
MKNAVQPATLFDSSVYQFSQVVTVPAGRQVFVAGQTAMDENGQIVGGDDFAAQCRQALTNVAHALQAAGATVADITAVRVYMVDYRPEFIDVLLPEFERFYAGTPPPASTWVGVQALALPELKIEIEAQAVIAG